MMQERRFYDFRHPEYRQGELIGMVDLVQLAGPLEVPIPQRWYALRTFPNCEAKVLRRFHREHVSYYYPTVRKTVVTRGRKRDVIEPLFPGIIFIPDFQAKLGLPEADGVDDYFRMAHCLPFVTSERMQDVRTLAGIGSIPAARKRRLWREGALVRVTDGPLASFNGIIERLDSNGRLKVLVDIFKRMTPVELEEGQIEPA